MQFNKTKNNFVSVRYTREGGTLTLDVPLNVTKQELTEMCNDVFFAAGISPIGKASDFTFDPVNFKGKATNKLRDSDGQESPPQFKDILKLTSRLEFNYILHVSSVKILVLKCSWRMCLDLRRAIVSCPQLHKTKARPGVNIWMPNLRMTDNCGGNSKWNRMKSTKNALRWIKESN